VVAEIAAIVEAHSGAAAYVPPPIL
jgi:hypothetical protein